MSKIFTVFAAILLVTSVASAVPMCTLGTDVLLLTDPCSFGGIEFGDFDVSVSGLTAATVFFGGGSGVLPGGHVNVQFQVVHDPSPVFTLADIILKYSATSNDLFGVDLGLGVHSGSVTITENVCNAPFLAGTTTCSDTIISTLVVSSGGPLFDEGFFAPPGTVYIAKDIQFLGASGAGATLSDFTNSHHVPEPMTLLLMGSGLLGLGLVRRRKNRA